MKQNVLTVGIVPLVVGPIKIRLIRIGLGLLGLPIIRATLMSQARRPSKVIGKFRGNLIILQNEEDVAEYERFQKDAKDFEAFLQEGFGGVYAEKKQNLD